MPAVILASLVRVIVAAFTMLALSSLSKSTRYVAVLYTGAIFFTEAMYGVLHARHRIDPRRLGLDHRATSTSITDVDLPAAAALRDAGRSSRCSCCSAWSSCRVSVLERRVRGVGGASS